MKIRRLTILITILLTVIGVFAQSDQEKFDKGREIMKKVDEQPEPKIMVSEQRMIIRKGGKEEVKDFYSLTKKVSDDESLSRIKFKDPVVKFLSHSFEKDDDLMYIKMPSDKQARRIVGDAKEGDYMGSHITYEDMESYDFDDFNYKYLGDGNINGEKHYLIEITKKDGDWGDYSKAWAYIRTSDYLLTFEEMFDKSRKKFKRMTMYYTQKDGYNIVRGMQIELIGEKNQWTKMGILNNNVLINVSESEVKDYYFDKNSLDTDVFSRFF